MDIENHRKQLADLLWRASQAVPLIEQNDALLIELHDAWANLDKGTPLVEIISQISKERENQNEQWGGPSHDDEHRTDEWFDFIEQQIWKHRNSPERFHDLQAKERLIKIAALCLAGLESQERQIHERYYPKN